MQNLCFSVHKKEMIYFLLNPKIDKKIPVLLTDHDEKSIKVTNLDGFSRWIRNTDFFVVGLNTIVLKETNGGGPTEVHTCNQRAQDESCTGS